MAFTLDSQISAEQIQENFFCFACFPHDQLAQLVEHQAVVREVTGSKLQLDQHSGSLNS